MIYENYTSVLLDHEVQKVKLPDAMKGDPLLDVSLLCIYKIATCDELCRGGDHIIEALVGRGFNLVSSSVILSSTGYYDEALNLLRSLGELVNIFAYLILYPNDYSNWASATKTQRMKVYSPSKIRKKIKAKNIFEPPMDNEQYAELCELVTHVTSKTVPNSHGAAGSGAVGGVHQTAGEEKVASLVSYLAAQFALLASKITGREDLWDEVDRVFSLQSQADEQVINT